MEKTITVGLRIQQRRKQLGLTQEALATKMGYKSKSTINKIEKCINDVSQSHIVKFAKALQTTEAFLMGWIDDPDKDIKVTIPIKKETIDTLVEKITLSESLIMDAVKADSKDKKEPIVSAPELDKALELYELYKNAIPQVQNAVEALLKPAQPKS